MSDWIEIAAEKLRQEQADRKEQQIRQSTDSYWDALLIQIQKDVIKINERFGSRMPHPVEVSASSNGYTIEQTSPPTGVTVYVRRKDLGIELETAFRKDGDEDFSREVRLLKVITDGHTNYLEVGVEGYLIPKQAAEFILKPVFHSLKDYIV